MTTKRCSICKKESGLYEVGGSRNFCEHCGEPLDLATDKWVTKQAVKIAAEEMDRDALEKDKETIWKAMKYRYGSVYMGSIATARMYNIADVPYGGGGFEAALKKADRKTVDRLLEAASGIISYMNKHPTEPCPGCGQTVSASEAARIKKRMKFK